jgi:hypothetical protein
MDLWFPFDPLFPVIQLNLYDRLDLSDLRDLWYLSDPLIQWVPLYPL